jgi:hypothetical protein
MIKRRKQAVTVAETPVVEAPATVTTEAPATVEVAVAAEPKAKKVRYAPTSILVDNAVITRVAPNTKRGKSADRYAKFYRVGVTVAELVAEYKAANLPGGHARLDLRWDVQHGNIDLGLPTEQAE